MSDANQNGALAPEEAAALKADQRKKLKRLQMIVHNRADAELSKVVNELREALNEYGSMNGHTNGERMQKRGRDRKEREGHDRAE